MENINVLSQEVNENYAIYNGDSCEVLAGVPENSIDLSVFSPPFRSLYTYSPTERDLGNSKTMEAFDEHFSFIIEHLLRVTKPGRNCCVHVAQLATTLTTHGYIGMEDFRGDTIKAFIKGGFIYHGEVTIDKDPQVQAIRTHAKGLLFVQLRKDASWMRPGFADYILVFRKPGENTVPVLPDITNEEWIQWAHPVWYDIKETETLNAAEGRDPNDERHICPLQLGVIERCIRLWSNPGETVLSPFMGIGSEGYQAMKFNRKFIGVELKESYFAAARRNLARILKERTQATLFDGLFEEEEPMKELPELSTAEQESIKEDAEAEAWDWGLTEKEYVEEVTKERQEWLAKYPPKEEIATSEEEAREASNMKLQLNGSREFKMLK